MDSVASFSFWGVGVMVMLARQVVGSAAFGVLKILSTIKKQKKPELIYHLLLLCSCHL